MLCQPCIIVRNRNWNQDIWQGYECIHTTRKYMSHKPTMYLHKSCQNLFVYLTHFSLQSYPKMWPTWLDFSDQERYKCVFVSRENKLLCHMQLYLIWTKRMPFITFSISRTLPMDGGWIWIGGRAVFDFPVYISFIFFWRTTACDVKCRKQSDDSRVFSWDSPSYTTEYSIRIISKWKLWKEQDYIFWVHLRVQLKDPSILQFHFNYIKLHSNYNNK